MSSPTANRDSAQYDLAPIALLQAVHGDGHASANEPLRCVACAASIDGGIELLKLVARHLRCVVFQYRLNADGSTCFPYISDNVSRFFKLAPADIYADPSRLFAQLLPTHRLDIDASIRRSADKLLHWKRCFQTEHGARHGHWLQSYALPRREADGAVLWHGIITDVTRRKRRAENVLQMAYYDALTSLPNRRLLSERLGQAIVESRRMATYSALLFLDLDHFKQLNDAYGHAAGDLLLVEAASRMKRVVREMDTVARLGGDEFVVVLRLLHNERRQAAELAGVIAAKIQQALAKETVLTLRHQGADEITITHRNTASIGITLFRDGGDSQSEILRRADRAMYQAKEAGRNSIRHDDQHR